MRIINILSDNDAFPYFFLKEYASFKKSSEGKNIIYFEDLFGNVMPVKLWRNKFLKFLQPIYPPLSPEGKRLIERDEQYFLNKFIIHVEEKKMAHRIVQPENFAIFHSVPRNSVYVPFGTYYLDLEKHSEVELFKNLHSKNRNVIRNAEKNNVNLKYGKECIEDFYLMYKQTMNRSDMYCQSISYFNDFYNKLPQNILCGVAYYNNIPQGGLFLPFTKFGAFYLYGSSKEKIEINGAINYLHWNTIKLLKAKGVKRYDFVGARLSDVSGTKLAGIQQFKERFGSELETGFLWKQDIGKVECALFDEASRIRYKLKKVTPLLDIIDEELMKKNITHKASLSKRVMWRVAKEKQSINKQFRTFKKGIDENELVDNLESAGIKNGDTIMVHSSLSKVGNIKGGAATVINALLKQIGASGNLVFPSYTYINSMEHTSEEKKYVFNPLTMPSNVGVISEEFRKWNNVRRSIHSTHSVVAYGPMAKEITEGHLNADTNFGLNTPFHKIRELKGKIVGLGINIGPVTIYHSVEDFFPELFHDIYLPDPVPIKVLVNEKKLLKSIYIHDPKFHSVRIDKNEAIELWLRNHFKEKGILHESPFGASAMWWMDIQELFDELISLAKRGISIYQVPAK